MQVPNDKRDLQGRLYALTSSFSPDLIFLSFYGASSLLISVNSK